MRQIRLTLKNYRCFEDSEPAIIEIDGGFLAFVGPNNGGKSSLLRFFYEFRPLFANLNSPERLVAYTFEDARLQSVPNAPDRTDVFCNLNGRDLSVRVDVTDLSSSELERGYIDSIEFVLSRSSVDWGLKLYRQGETARFSTDARVHTPTGPSPEMKEANEKVTAIAEILEIFEKAQYFGPFRNAIAVDAESRYYDIEVGKSLIRTWQSTKTGAAKSKNLKIFELTKRVCEAFELENLEISSSDDGKTLAVVLNSKPYSLSELGGGLAQFIIVLTNAALKEPSLILIDEPESNLHPVLQLKFLTTLGSFARDGVLFATHNYGLARASAFRTYLVKRDNATSKSRVSLRESMPSLSEFLGEMSYSGRHDLGVEAVLLVEGSTDLTAMQQFLIKAKKDHKVLMLTLGGATLIHGGIESQLLELQRITPQIYALIDSERDSATDALPTNRQAFVDACTRANVVVRALDRRALENYFSDRAVKRVKSGKYRALSEFESLRDCDPAWGKGEGYKIAAEMNLAELDNTDLGTFIANLP